jgi:hypothetical protein
MDDDEKGKRFLELINDQNNVQWGVITKLSSLISSEWESVKLREDLKILVEKHSEITKELNSLDDGASIL